MYCVISAKIYIALLTFDIGGVDCPLSARFVYGFGAIGVFTTLTASTGILAANADSGCLLDCVSFLRVHVVLFLCGFLLFLQGFTVCLCVFVLFLCGFVLFLCGFILFLCGCVLFLCGLIHLDQLAPLSVSLFITSFVSDLHQRYLYKTRGVILALASTQNLPYQHLGEVYILLWLPKVLVSAAPVNLPCCF